MYRKQLNQHFLVCARSSQIGPVFTTYWYQGLPHWLFVQQRHWWAMVAGWGGGEGETERMDRYCIQRLLKNKLKPIQLFISCKFIFLSKIISNVNWKSRFLKLSHYLKYYDRLKCFQIANLTLHFIILLQLHVLPVNSWLIVNITRKQLFSYHYFHKNFFNNNKCFTLT